MKATKTIRWARLLWSLALGLGLTLALFGVVMPHSAANGASEPHIRLEKNPTYYDAASVAVTEATSFYFDADEAWARYQTGELDTIAPPISALDEIKASPVYSPQLHVHPGASTYFYLFSNDVPPFDDPLVRGAFSSALDRPRLIRETLTGDELPALTLTPPNHFGHVDGYTAGIGRPYSPTLAQNLLAASGYTGDPPITLMFNTSPFHQAIAEAIRQMWIETLGITVTLQDLPWGEYNDLLRNGSAAERPGIFRMGWRSDYPDANNWHHDALANNTARYDNPAYDALVDAAAGETDPATRMALYEQTEATLVMTDTAIAPLFYSVNHRLTRPDLDRTYYSLGGQHLEEWSFSGAPRPLEIAWGYPGSLDPATSWDPNYLNQLFLALTGYDQAGNVVPQLATGWDVSPDARVYTFTMRADAVWTDGNPVTAYDVEYGVLRSLDPKLGGNGWALYTIENAQAYNQGDITDPGLVGVEPLDATHIRFTLAEPAAYFPAIVGLPPARPQPRWVIEAHGEAWTDPANIVTSGPYRLTHWDQLPHLRIYKEGEGTPGEGSNFLFLIEYWNEGGAPAENTVITDTMQGMAYLSDTSPFTHSGSGAPGDPIVWHLGTLPAHSKGDFDVFVQVTAGVSETISNRAQIDTSNPDDQGGSWEKESEWSGHVEANDTYLNVGKGAWTHDPAPGHEFIWGIDVCNNGSTNSSEVTLTDTLPISTTLVDWWDDDAGWIELLRTSDQLVLSRPLIRDYRCRQVYLRFHLDEHAWRDMEISNTVTIAAANDLEADDNTSTNWVQVGEPYTNLYVRKGWTHGQLLPGGEIVYEINYGNDGNVPVDNVLITSTLPASTTFDHIWKAPWSSYITPTQVTDDYLVWDLGALEGGYGGLIILALKVDDDAVPGTVLNHTVEISPKPGERRYEDNVITWVETLNPAGPNLEVYKKHWYRPGDDHIDYEISVKNRGSERVENVSITDTYPLDTTWDGNWWGCHWAGPEFSATHDEPNHRIIFETDELATGDYGCIGFRVNLDDPGARFRWYTNTVEIDTPPGDTNPANNRYVDELFSGGEVDQVDLDVGGHHIWGEVPDGPINITTPSGSTVLPWGGHFDWDAPERIQPGDTIIVEAGAGTHPVVIQVPDPFDAMADSNTDTVWGQIDALDHEWITVDLYDGPIQQTQTDSSGNFSTSFPDVPRGAEGEVRYRTEIDYAKVTFHRRIQSLDLIITVDYEHDWVNGDYEPGHTVWITVTESDGSTVKATAELTTGPIPWWGGQSGFETQWEDWVPGPGVDIEPGDWVYGRVDNGNMTTVQVGTINGEIDVDADTVFGTIDAPWLTPDLVTVRCEIHEEDGESIEVRNVNPDGGGFFCDFSGLYDIRPGHNVAVNYTEPDGDRVQTHPQNPAPDMQVEKWVEGNEVAPGGPVVFTIRYRNEGDAVAETIWLTDTLPANTTYIADSSGVPANVVGNQVIWALGPLDAGEQRQFQLVLSNSAGISDTLRNQVDAYTRYDTDEGNNHAETEVHVGEGQPDLYVNKDPDPGDPAPGQTFLYRIHYGNSGPVASGPVVLADTLPAGTTVDSWYSENDYNLWTDVSTSGDRLVLEAPSIPGYWGDRIMLRLRVDPGVEEGTQLTNRVEIATANDADPDNNWHVRDDVWVNRPRWDVGIYKSFNWARLMPGGRVEYSVDFGNHGNMATQAWVTDNFPAGTSFVEAWPPPDTVDGGSATWSRWLEPGQSANVNIRLAIDRAVMPGTIITNCATITIDGDDQWPDNDTDCVMDTVREPGPNLRVHKRYWWDWEGQIQYEIRVENVGTQRLEDVWISDTYPESTAWNGDWWVNHGPWITVTHDAANRQLIFWAERFDPGETASIGFRVDLDGAVIGEQGLAFGNLVEAPIPGDVHPADNTAEVTAYTGIDLYAEKWISGGEPRPGARITLTLRYGNASNWPQGTSGGASTRLAERLPAGMTYVASVWPDGNPHPPFFHDPLSGLIIWDIGGLGSNDHRWFYLVVDLDTDLEGGDVLLNQLEFQEQPPDDVDYDLANNVFELPVTVLNPKFEVGKIYEGNGVAGTVVTYTLTVTNVGSEAGTNVVLSDTLPAGLTYGGGDGSLAGNDVTWTFGSIAPNGGTATGWFWGTLTCSADQTVSNEHYRVVSSDQGITTLDGAPVSFTTVAPTLSPAFDQSATEVIIGETVYFTDTSSTDGAGIVAWAWDFGDGETGSGATTSHVYDALNTYTVTLTITDTCGYSDSVSVPNAVTVEQIRVYLPLVVRNYTP